MHSKRIPVSISLDNTFQPEEENKKHASSARRMRYLAFLAVIIATLTGGIARFLVSLIDFFTNLFFFGRVSLTHASPEQHHLGAWVIAIPMLGGVIVGFMARFGSKAIRGHGIPEAMEQILTNQSRIKPIITFLKPISSAISIGTGGPFGAEGPIIATGGALGSTIGQFLRISPDERKILLTAGATAGMSAIFGTPVAAIFLAIELLLFEFSPRSIIPIALACITGAAMHKLLFGNDPVFLMPVEAAPSNPALAIYSLLGILMGFLASGVTKAVYAIEDGFEKLPIPWYFWPALGGLAVGVVGWLAPKTFGVGYSNIDLLLRDPLTLRLLLVLSLYKFLSWSISLGSGTSGGTLAPLFTIGGAAGALMGTALLYYFPNCGITIHMAALIGMSAMFAGASRALLTSIIFALESTGQSTAILPLLGACIASYIVSYFLLENTIMTEKIARRGVATPSSYEPDILIKYPVSEFMQTGIQVLSGDNTIADVQDWMKKEQPAEEQPALPTHFIVVDNSGHYLGLVPVQEIYNSRHELSTPITSLLRDDNRVFVLEDQSLKTAVEIMATADLNILPVVSSAEINEVTGLLSYNDTLEVYRQKLREANHFGKEYSLKHQAIRIILKGKGILLSR
jgi:chloride channel protein, CIC family